jgi:hypothetical protein
MTGSLLPHRPERKGAPDREFEMVDQFQAYLLLVLTALFVIIVFRVVRDDHERVRRWRRLGASGPTNRSPPSR